MNEHPGPSASDRALLLASGAFVAMGLLLLGRDLKLAITTLTFFGACFAFALANYAQKRRFGRYRITRASIVGGVRMRPSRIKTLLVALVTLAVGAVPLALDVPAPIHVRGAFWLIAVTAAGVVIAVVLGKAPVGFVQFDPPGITLGYRGYSMMVPWDSISGIAAGEAAHHPALFIFLNDASKLEIMPRHAGPRAARGLATTRSWYGADLCPLPDQYGLDLPLLIPALERYLNEPARRAELGIRAAQPPSLRNLNGSPK